MSSAVSTPRRVRHADAERPSALDRAAQRVVAGVLQWPPGVRLFHGVLRSLFGLKIHGRELLPDQRPLVLVSNHGSHYDGLFLRVIGRELIGSPIVSVAWGGVRLFPFARAALEGHAFPVVLTDDLRDTSGTRAGVLEQMIEHLRAGRSLALNPEGDRYDRLTSFRPGAAFAAREAGVPLVPMTLRGVHGLWSTLPWPRCWWGKVSVQLHPPVLPQDYATLPPRQAMEAMTAEARRRIASALDYEDGLA